MPELEDLVSNFKISLKNNMNIGNDLLRMEITIKKQFDWPEEC